MDRPNNQEGCTKFGTLINGQGAIRAGMVSNFSEIDKRACLFIRQVRVHEYKYIFDEKNL